MNQILNEEIKDHLRPKIPLTKNLIKLKEITSKATTSLNFYKPKIKKDIMEKITNILNNKHSTENFDSCYLNGNPNNNPKYPVDNYYSNKINKNDFLKTANCTENKFFLPKQKIYSNINNDLNYNINNKKYTFEDKNEILKHLKNEGLKALSPKNNLNNNDNNKNILFFENKFNVYRDANLNKLNMPYASSNFSDKYDKKIFTDKINIEINAINNHNKNLKNNYKLFHEQFNISKSKQNKNSHFRESFENKAESNTENFLKKGDQDKSPKYIKSRDPESANLFLTKFNMKIKNNKNENINKLNFSNSNSLKNLPAQNENINKESTQKNSNLRLFHFKEVLLNNKKKEIEYNFSKSIDIDKESDSSYHSLKNEFSFLLEKKGESESYNLGDIMNDVKMVQNKLSSECDDLKNLLKFANDTKSKLQMHKTENRFFKVNKKLNSNNINNFNYKAYSNNINNMIVNRTNAYLKGISNSKNKNTNSFKKENENFEEKKINENKVNKLLNPNSLSVDEYLLIGENSKINKKEKVKVMEINKKLNKKRAFSDMNYEAILPHISDKIDKNVLQPKNLTSKNISKGKNFIKINCEENQTNNYYMIKSQMKNKKNEKDENLNEEFVFDPSDLEIHKRKIQHKNRNQPPSNIMFESDPKSANNDNFNSINNGEFKYDFNNNNIFDRKIKTIYNLDNKQYLGKDKINIEKFNKNFALQNKFIIGTNNNPNKKTIGEKVSLKDLNCKEEKKNGIYFNFKSNKAIIAYRKHENKKNLSNFNEIKKNENNRKMIFDSLEDEKLNSEENINLNIYRNNHISNNIHKKFSGSLNNFHKNKISNIESLEVVKKESNGINANLNKYSNPQPHIFNEFNANNPFIKSIKNSVNKKNFFEIINKNSNLSQNKNSNKFSFEKKNMSKTNYNFAEFKKSNGNA
jgi:hypothetical protein